MDLHHLEFGQGQHFIILHGLFGFSDNWLTHAKKLSHYFKVTLLDMRNHGHSPWDNAFNYQVMADDVWEFIRKNDYKDVVLLGHSMGGKVAMEFALKHSDLIKKLIIVDIGFKKYPMHHQQILEALHSVTLYPDLSRKEAEQRLSNQIESVGVRQFLLKNLYWNKNKQLTWRMNLSVIEYNMENILNEIQIEKPIKIPTLFLKGDESNYILEEDYDQIEEKFIDVQIVGISGAGHWIHSEKPNEFLEQVLQFCLR